jgi:hypothetical protein
LPDLTAITNLAPRIAKSGTLWTQTANSTGVSTESNLFYVPDLTSDSYQLTRTITASKALFALNTQNYPTSGSVKFFGGWTFLPGGLLYQYGTFDNGTNLPLSQNVLFPIVYNNNVFNVQVTLIGPDSSLSDSQTIAVVTSGTNGFKVRVRTNSASYTGFYWTAIGI